MQNRRTLFTAAGSGALAALLSSTRQTTAQTTNDTTTPPPTVTTTVPTDPFILLLRGIYVPITSGPNLGLHGINLDDGTYSRTSIYAVFGVPDPEGADERESNNVPTKPSATFMCR
jgi:hypothetical protein